MQNNIMLVSGPVIVKNDKVLLNISGDDDFWKFIGGRRIADEDLRRTAKLRAQEEMGVEINIINNTPYIIYLEKEIDGKMTEIILFHWLAEIDDEIKPGEMVKEWKWIDLNELPDNLAPNIKPALKHFGF